MKNFDFGKYEINIGIETHVALKSKKKMFSDTRIDNNDISNPNKYISIVDLAYPGTLPQINRDAILTSIKIAKILNCKIAEVLEFDRKHYFYPDSPRGYQITQKRNPIGKDGFIKVHFSDDIGGIVDIMYVIIEEDTAKTIYNENSSLLNFSRQGIPIVEIVTKPCISDVELAVNYVKVLRSILIINEISEARMEKAELRCDVNVSVRKKASKNLGVKNEIKNINSIHNLREALTLEISRQIDILSRKREVYENTWRYDDKLKKNILMRNKESKYYYYIPEYDIPPIDIKDIANKNITYKMSLVEEIRKYCSEDIPQIQLKHILADKELFSFFKQTLQCGKINIKILLNMINRDIKEFLNNKNKKINEMQLSAEEFYKLLNEVNNSKISYGIAKEILNYLLENGGKVEEVLKKIDLIKEDELLYLIKQFLDNNGNLLEHYKQGNKKLFGYFFGSIIKNNKDKKIDPRLLKKLLEKELNDRK